MMELVMDSVGAALTIIHSLTYSHVHVNQNQCRRLAERFHDISKALEELNTELNGDTFLETLPIDQTLMVLKKGKALIESYANERSAIQNVLYRADNSEAFKEVHEEIDTLGTYLDLGQTEKDTLLNSDAEDDRGEIIRRAYKLILGDTLKVRGSMVGGDVEGDVENMEKAVFEKCYNVDSNAEDLSYLNIPFSAIHLDDAIKELKPLIERNSQADARLDGLALVHKGRWNGCNCAIKVFKSADIHWNTEELHKEIASLAKLRHPHILQLIGCGQHYDKTYVLYEMMDSDLRTFIDSRMKRNISLKSLQDDRPLSRTEEVSIIMQIARAMFFMHEKGLVHGELKCSNVLVKEVGDHIDVKVADFHCSRQLGQTPTNKYKPAHRPRWMPPEAFQHYNVDQPSVDLLKNLDVYSFGMVAYEVVTGKYPFDGVRGIVLEEKIKAGERPELPNDLNQGLKRLITECWHEDPEHRPSFQDICYVLKVYAVKLTTQVEKLFPRCLGRCNQESVRDALEGKEWSDLFSERNELKVRSIREIDDAAMHLPHYLKIRPSDLKPVRLLGKGASAQVFEASWLGCTFAVKVFRGEHVIKLRQDVSIMMKLLHPHVIRLVGFSVLANRCAIVMELMDMSLRDLMDSRIKDKHSAPFSESEALGIITRLALGMAFLHSRGVAHRDLKCANVLVTRVSNSKNTHYDVKLVDFGVSRILPGERSPFKAHSHTLGLWRAPEIIEKMDSKSPVKIDFKAADVYSFAMTCYELLTGMYPFDGVRGKALKEKIISGERPELPKLLNQGLKRLITECWHADPKKRPSFPDICCVLKVGAMNLTSHVEKLFSSCLRVDKKMSVAGMGVPTRNWCAEEIHALLELVEEALRPNEGPDLWDCVSENLWEEYGFDRSSNSCQQQWDSLLRSYRAIQDHESKIQSGTSSCASYWKMNDDERSKTNLQRAFDLEWCEMIETILTVKPSQIDADLVYPALPDLDEVQYNEVMDSFKYIEEIDTHSESEGLSVESTATTATTRHRAEGLEDDVISRIAPFVNKQIEDAFKPLIAVMRRHKEKLIT